MKSSVQFQIYEHIQAYILTLFENKKVSKQEWAKQTIYEYILKNYIQICIRADINKYIYIYIYMYMNIYISTYKYIDIKIPQSRFYQKDNIGSS